MQEPTPFLSLQIELEPQGDGLQGSMYSVFARRNNFFFSSVTFLEFFGAYELSCIHCKDHRNIRNRKDK